MTGLTAATVYSVDVTSWNATGQSPPSTCVPFTTASPSFLPPAPTGVAVTSITADGGTVTWTQATGGGIVNNTVYVFENDACSVLGFAVSTGGPATSYVITTLNPAQTYSVEVTAWNATGQSPPSACVAWTTHAPGYCSVTVSESGLPSGLTWTVTGVAIPST